MVSLTVRDVVPFIATCCVITSIYTDMPDCLGASGKYQLLCLDLEYQCGGVSFSLTISIAIQSSRLLLYCLFA